MRCRLGFVPGFASGQRRRWRWLLGAALGVLVALLPYLSLAAVPAAAPLQPPLSLTEGDLLAQLDRLPQGTVSLPNFDPAVNGFQFSNRELVEAIDLSRNAERWEIVLTEQMQRLFGSQVCGGGLPGGCVLTAAAQRWLQTQLSRMDQGMSEGMAAAVLDLWQPVPTPIPWWQRLINALLRRTVFGLVRTLFDLQTFIANLFLMQGVAEVFQPTQAIRTTLTPTQILVTLVQALLTGSADPFTMGVYRRGANGLSEGHSLTPYRVESRGNGQYWVYVYDSNYPAGRSSSPAQLHVEFDTNSDRWRYRPLGDGAQGKNAAEAIFEGDSDSQTLDLTRRSWRHPGSELPTGPTGSSALGPATCPFCAGEDAGPTAAPPTGLDVTLVGEGRIAVTPQQFRQGRVELGPKAMAAASTDSGATLVPFRGGLDRAVPASYHFGPDALDQLLRVDLTGTTEPTAPATLQFVGPGFAADIQGLVLSPDQPLTLYLLAADTGPEITFVAPVEATVPRLAISLIDRTTADPFDASRPDWGFALTTRRVSRSSGFELTGLRLPAGRRAALVARTDLQRLYFADDAAAPSECDLTVKNRLVVEDRTQVGATQPDFFTYTLTYEEEMLAQNIDLAPGTQAFFDYAPGFVEPGQLPREELVEALNQRQVAVTIGYEPLAALTPSGIHLTQFSEYASTPVASGPLVLVPSGEDPLSKRVFQGLLRSRELALAPGGRTPVVTAHSPLALELGHGARAVPEKPGF